METTKDLEKKDQLLKINDISKRLNLTPRAIRYYESEKLLDDVKRSIGLTRYFTNNDVIRLKEIKRLKKSGKKIAEIKSIFKLKYKSEKPNGQLDVAIASPFIEAEDIQKCLSLGVDILECNIVFQNIKLNYVDWPTITDEEFLKPFQIESVSSSKKICFERKTTNTWLGNGQRAIVKDLLNHPYQYQINKSFLDQKFNSLTEWLILPIQIDSRYNFKDQLSSFFLLEKRSKNQYEKKIITLNQLISDIEKDIKEISSSVQGMIKHICVHYNSNNKYTADILDVLKNICQNKDQLTIERLSPIYIQSIGSNQALLLSTFT
tara:strand:+ start:415 stop:1374 length:960 start_codon:yes stop_codon:yes gene_type:complete